MSAFSNTENIFLNTPGLLFIIFLALFRLSIPSDLDIAASSSSNAWVGVTSSTTFVGFITNSSILFTLL